MKVSILILFIMLKIFISGCSDKDYTQNDINSNASSSRPLEQASIEKKDASTKEDAENQVDSIPCENRNLLELSLARGDVQKVEYLLENKKLNAEDPNDSSFLFTALFATDNQYELLTILYKSGLTDFNISGSMGYTLLYWVAYNDDEDSASFLLKHGADINMKDSFYGETPLHTCAKKGNWSVARVLLENGADYTIQDKNGKVPLDRAIEPSNPDLASIKGKKKVAKLIREQMKKDTAAQK